MDPQRRRWKRHKVDIRVRLRRWEEPEEAAMVVRTYELSEGGMSVYASEALDVGTVLLVEFTPSTASKALRLKAVVRNRRGFRFGMEFPELSLIERSELKRYLAIVEGVVDILET